MQSEYSEKKLLWSIGEMDDLPDTFRIPMASRTFTADGNRIKGWPSFHPSSADPDGKYQEFEYSISFDLEEVQDAYLHIAYIVSTPRYPDIEITINGNKGYCYPYPAPSKDKVIKPAHALHASIYNKDDIWLYLPAKLFLKGSNLITIKTMDDNPVMRIDNEQAVLRLDRMADACGFHYGAMELIKTDEIPPNNHCEIRSSVIYLNDDNGQLTEKCYVCIHNVFNEEEILKGFIKLQWNDGEMSLPYHLEVSSFGQIVQPFLLPDGEGEVKYEFTGDLKTKGSFMRKRKWKVYTTPHAHTDIGYTHRQWEVAERMCRNIDTALEMLKGEYGKNFSYIIDATWHLEEYLISRSAKQKEELIEAIKSGRFGVAWNYADLLTQLPTLEALIHNGDYISRLLDEYGLIADRSDIVDVASATGSYPSVLSGSGVKYLLHADNQDRGPFRFNGELHRHSPFWWKSPDGSRVLTWLARMYCELKKVCGSPASIQAAERGLELWLMDYEREDYIPDAVILYGQEADNTDIDTRTAKFMTDWEKEIVYPKLIPSNGSTFFDYVMQYSDYFEEYSGDEGAYWEDGAASSVKETFAVREAEAGIRAAEILDTLAMMHSSYLKFPTENYNEAWKQVLLYNEHTWGAFLTGSDPDALLQKDQWAIKAHMAKQANQWKERLLLQAASKISLMWNNNSREIVVYNPYSFPVEGNCIVEFSVDETVFNGLREGKWEEINRTATQVVAYLWIEELNPFSYRRYQLKKRTKPENGGYRSEKIVAGIVCMENEWYEVKIDTDTACIISLFDKDLNKELCSGQTLGQILYAKGGEGTTLLGNRPGLSEDGADIMPCFYPEKAVQKESLVRKSLCMEGKAELGRLQVIYSLPMHEKAVCIEYQYDKEETIDLEAVYVDFPFLLPDTTDILSDSQIGWVNWHKETLPGACKEWLPLQTSILMRGNECDIQIASPNAFLFTVGNPVQGKWTSDLRTHGNRVYSYVLNNYWRVNYQAKQGGNIRFCYAITSADKIPYEQAYRFGWTRRQGLYAQRMSYQEFRKEIPDVYQNNHEGTLLEVDSKHIVVSTIRAARDGEGIILRLQEIGGFSGYIKIKLQTKKIISVSQTDHQERLLSKINSYTDYSITLRLNPWEVSTYKIIHE